jgi:Bacterial membrane protein YfhO
VVAVAETHSFRRLPSYTDPVLTALLLYLTVAVVTLLAWNRWVTHLSRGAGIVLILLPFLFTGPALVTNRVYGGYDILFLSQPFSDYAQENGFTTAHNGLLVDHVLQMVPWQQQVRQSLAHRQWPLWNPAMDSGEVLAAGMQAAPLNPLNLIALLLPLDLATTFNASMIFFLGALFTFAFAREIECSEGAALIAAAGFTLCGAMAFFASWPHGRSWTVLPFVLLAVRRVARKRDVEAFSLLTFAFALLIVFGHPETMLHVAAIGAAFGIFEIVPLRRQWWRPAAIALVAGALALLLTAILLLPFLAVLTYSFEYWIRQTPPPPAAAHEVWKAVRATFLPYYGGASWHTPTSEWDFGMARVGSVILALAVIASVRLWRRRDVRFFGVLCAVTMLASWKAPPVDRFLRALPLFKLALNDRLGFAAALSLALLAAMAFDASARRDRRIVIIVAAVLAIATAWFWRLQVSIGVDPKLLIAAAGAELIGMAILFAAMGTASRRGAMVLIVAAIAGQRLIEDSNIHPTLPRHMFYPSVPLIATIPRDPLYRFTAIGNMVIPNVATMYGLEDIRGYSAMTYVPYVETMSLWCPAQKRTYHDVTDLSLPFLSFLGVRHAITPRTMEPPPEWRIVADDRSSRLMENTRAIPRVFVPRRIRFIDSDQRTLEEMAAATDFTDEAWILTHDVPPQLIENGEAVLQVHRTGARYEIDADVHSACRIVITEASWPGWRAYIDGRRVRMEQANRAFLSMYVPPGRHHLQVVYLPDAFVRGRVVSLGTLSLIVIAIGVRRWRRSSIRT